MESPPKPSEEEKDQLNKSTKKVKIADSVASSEDHDLYPDFSQSDEDMDDSKEFNPNPEIQISHEDFDSWCKPWRNTLIIEDNVPPTSPIGQDQESKELTPMETPSLPHPLDQKADSIFGPWMMAKKPQRRCPVDKKVERNKEETEKEPLTLRSRFNLLSDANITQESKDEDSIAESNQQEPQQKPPPSLIPHHLSITRRRLILNPKFTIA
ncbi:hypothetical protein SESBI_31914 [Sesbania bispinosa]|nr:hypothetical protein SESBI_31914 [Sesbania bispinosa]